MNIAFITTYNSRDVYQWSGAGAYIAMSLEQQQLKMDRIQLQPPPQFLVHAARLKHFPSYAFSKRPMLWRSPSILRFYSRQVAAFCHTKEDQLLFSPGSPVFSYYDGTCPYAFWVDATYAAMLDYYPDYMNVSRTGIKNGHQAEHAALARCSAAIYASQWAAESAIKDYKADPARVHVVPFGANTVWQFSAEDIQQAIKHRGQTPLRLLFAGVDWERKGGPTAVAAAEHILASGQQVQLDIVGCTPPSPLPDFCRVHGFLSKKSPSERARLTELFVHAHFLIHPAHAEAYGLVCAEASSVGVPAIVRATGGLPTVVRHSLNGFCLPPDAGPEAFAHTILSAFHPSSYETLCRSSYREYQQRLNWDVAGAAVARILEGIIL